MAFNLKKFLGGSDVSSEDEYYTLSVEEATREETQEGSKMILLEPRAYSVSGCLYAIGGTMQKLGDGIFLCAPKNINVQGKMTEEEEPKRGRTKNISEDF